MSVNDDMMIASSDSFWEIGKFMKTVKRSDTGHKLCDKLLQMVDSRNKIEKKYAKDLVQWNKTWNTYLDGGDDYGTMLGAWRGQLAEADSLAEMHSLMADRVMNEVHQSIKLWQKENYHKSMMHFKETKEFEDNFRKAQKPWGKKLSKMMTAKKDYHSACRQEKSTANQENNARADSAVSPDQLKKLQEKLRKLQDEVTGTREKYQASLNDMNSYNAKYMEDMTEVYNKCQSFEKLRIEFFKKTLFQMHACLDLSVEARYGKIYTDLHSTIGNTDAEKDLKYWSVNNGVDMAMNWPTFEEYSPELQSISRKQKSQIGGGDGSITITRFQPNRKNSFDNYPPAEHNNPASHNRSGSSTSQPEPQVNNTDTVQHTSSVSTPPPPSDDYNGGGAANPFGDQVSDDERSVEDDDPATARGVAVKAIYDYVKTEDDEFSFKSGEVFVKLSEEDEMGWCKGRKDGDIGLFPANYVVLL